ncbi:hypothetical protein TNCV_3525111 [Trichonephila clavipes]|uniref:Uncharacterized protein n=1 Tax=Trichonephila clavipes TaxID=2585209 RepID=A0A8X6S8I2_TRICX|nr:hypothetical protein TNCV_3525111 [Trichonephila clavipes]
MDDLSLLVVTSQTSGQAFYLGGAGYTPASTNLCFVFCRNGYENALSRNIQNGTDHSRFRNSQKIFSSLKKGAPEFEPGPSRSAVECSTTESILPANVRVVIGIVK